LGKEQARLFCDIYDVSKEGNWEGKNILHLRRSLDGAAKAYGLALSELKDQLARDRQRLFEARAQRIPPATDDKILTDWNGLMISAFCKGYQILGDQKYFTAAQKAVDFLLEKLYIGGRILKTYRSGKSHLNGYLSDYAFLIAALIDLYESNFQAAYLSRAIEINELMLQKFWDDESGGFFFTPDDHERLIVRTRNAYDNAIPSGNSVAVHNLLKLSQFTGDFKLKDKAEQTLKLFVTQMQRSPSGFAILLSSLDHLWGKPKEIVIAGDRKSADTQEMIAAVHQHYLPNKILAYADPDLAHQEAAALPVIEGKIAQNGQAKMFVCENYACQTPFLKKDEFESFYDSLIGS